MDYSLLTSILDTWINATSLSLEGLYKLVSDLWTLSAPQYVHNLTGWSLTSRTKDNRRKNNQRKISNFYLIETFSEPAPGSAWIFIKYLQSEQRTRHGCVHIYLKTLFVIHTGRCSLLPVVNNSGAICNSWKLDPATLRFPLKGLLPYDKVCC